MDKLADIAARISARKKDEADERTAIIRKVPGKEKWKVLSEKGKSLGEYDSKAKAEKRLQQVEMFKHMKKKGKGKKRKSSEPLEAFNQYLSVACGGACPICGGLMQYDDSRDAYVCPCGYVGPNSSAGSPGTTVAAMKASVARSLERAAATNPRLASILRKAESTNMTTPSSIANDLRRIAAGIDNSREPDPRLVTAAIRNVIAAVEAEASVPGMEWLKDDELLQLSESLVAALKKKSAGELEKIIPQMFEMLKRFEFALKAERQKKQLKPGS